MDSVNGMVIDFLQDVFEPFKRIEATEFAGTEL